MNLSRAAPPGRVDRQDCENRVSMVVRETDQVVRYLISGRIVGRYELVTELRSLVLQTESAVKTWGNFPTPAAGVMLTDFSRERVLRGLWSRGDF